VEHQEVFGSDGHMDSAQPPVTIGVLGFEQEVAGSVNGFIESLPPA
jgi:hypothetical protein